jgi:hypothetical protein
MGSGKRRHIWRLQRGKGEAPFPTRALVRNRSNIPGALNAPTAADSVECTDCSGQRYGLACGLLPFFTPAALFLASSV